MKQRIMGIIILVAIALIFIPLLFSRSGSSSAPHSTIKTVDGTTLPAHSATTQTPLNNPPPPHPYQPTDASAPQTEQEQVVFENSSPTAKAPTTTQPNTPAAQTTQVQVGTLTPSQINPDSNNGLPPTKQNLINNPPDSNNGLPPTNQNPVNNQPPAADNAIDNSSQQQQAAPATTTIQPSINTSSTPTNSMATSESGVLQAAQQQFNRSSAQQSSAEPKQKNIHNTATKHVKQHPQQNTKATNSVNKTHTTTNKSTANEPRHGWIVQLGSFTEQSHIEKLAQQLHAHGFVPHVMPVKTAHGTVTRVYIGPETQRQKAEQISKQLNDKLSIHSIVVPL